MTVSYFVRYEGQAEDPQAFIAHYRERHVPILARLPGIRRIVLHLAVECNDPFPVKRGRTAMLAQLVFDSQAALDNALASAERAEARADFTRFPPFRGEVSHQAMESIEISPSEGR